ncbi:MAG: ABC-type Fe3+ transport system permease component, partial [Chloroflexi bacterium]|nr:ABC-type Fe3+ transport system permease component [Chloroflexota bacterium]
MAEIALPTRRSLIPGFLWRLSWAQIGMLLLIGAFGFYLLYPLILILINSFNTARIGQPPVYGIEGWVKAWQTPGIWNALRNTLLLAVAYQVISFPIGILISWLLARTNVPWAHGLEFFFWLSFFLPSLSITLGWMLLADPRAGVLNHITIYLANMVGMDIKQGPFNVYTFWGIVWVHLMAHAISGKVMLLTTAFRNMDASLEEASRMSGASNIGTFLRVTLPVMTPALVIVFMLQLVRTLESFEIELLLGVPQGLYVYSTAIVDMVKKEPPQLGGATALGSVTLLFLIIAVPVQRWLTTRRDYTTITGKIRPTLIDLGPWRWVVFAAILLLATMLVIIPLFSVVVGSFMTRFGFFNLPTTWTTGNWARTLNDTSFTKSLINTLIIAGVAAIVGPIILSLTAYVIVRAKVWGKGVLDSILWIPSVIPGALASLGLLWMFLGTPIFNPLYGTIFLLIIASVMGGVTISTQIFKAAVLQLGKEMEESSRMSGGGSIGTYFRIVAPLMVQTFVLIATLKFMFAANATSSVILLATSDTRTISLLTLDFVFEGLRESAAVCT